MKKLTDRLYIRGNSSILDRDSNKLMLIDKYIPDNYALIVDYSWDSQAAHPDSQARCAAHTIGKIQSTTYNGIEPENIIVWNILGSVNPIDNQGNFARGNIEGLAMPPVKGFWKAHLSTLSTNFRPLHVDKHGNVMSTIRNIRDGEMDRSVDSILSDYGGFVYAEKDEDGNYLTPRNMFAYSDNIIWENDSSVWLYKFLTLIQSFGKLSGKTYKPQKIKWYKKLLGQADMKSSINKIIEDMSDRHSNLVRESNDLMASWQNRQRELMPIQYLINNKSNLEKSIHESLVKASKIDEVSSCFLDREGQFNIITKALYIKVDSIINGADDNLYYSMGKLHIRVNENYKVYIKGFDVTVRGYDGNFVSHPHVISSDGSTCLGDIASVVPQLVNARDYTSLTRILINFCQTANVGDSAGKYITEWPTVQL